MAQQTGDDDDDEHVEGERSQPEPQRPVRAEERHDEVDQAQLGVGVEEQQRHVQHDKERSGQRGEAVDVGDGEPGQRATADGPNACAMPSADEMVRNASAVIPVPRPSAHSASSVIGGRPVCGGHPPTVWTTRSLSTSRAGMPSAESIPAHASRARSPQC